jgi:hypothetical protein
MGGGMAAGAGLGLGGGMAADHVQEHHD